MSEQTKTPRDSAADFLKAKAKHVRENAETLKAFEGSADEGRCRELAAMFLEEVADHMLGFPSLGPIRKLAAESERDAAIIDKALLERELSSAEATNKALNKENQQQLQLRKDAEARAKALGEAADTLLLMLDNKTAWLLADDGPAITDAKDKLRALLKERGE